MTVQKTTPQGMRICWIDTMRYTDPLSETQAKKWRALTEGLGVEIYITSFAPGLRPRRFTQGAHFILYPQLPAAVLRYLTLYTLAPMIALWLVFRHGVEVLITHDPNVGFAGAVVKGVAGIFGKRVALVVETRGDFEVNVFLQRKVAFKGLYQKLMAWTARYAFRRADALRALSRATREQLERWSPDTPIVEFMSWTDSEAFINVRRDAPPSQQQDVVYVGVLVPGKGVHILVDAFAQIAQQHPAARLWLVGRPQRPDYVSELEAQIARLDLREKVIFVGAVPQVELAEYIARGRVFVLPTFSEGLPKVVVEAQLTGAAVIATTVGGIPDVIEDGVTGYLIPPGDVDALAEKLRYVFNGADVDAVGAQAREFAMRYFSPAAYVQHYGALFLLAYKERQGR